VGNVQRVLAKVPGVLAVEGDPQTKEITIIRQEGRVADEDLAELITRAGHVVAGEG
jgi:copper chaperone CopZ